MIMNATACDTIRREVNAALKAIADKHGVTFDLGRMTYTSTEIRCKLTARNAGAAVIVPTKRDNTASNLPVYASFDNVDLNAVHVVPTGRFKGTYKLAGYNTRAKSMPYILRDTVTGKEIKAPTSYVRTNFAKAA